MKPTGGTCLRLDNRSGWENNGFVICGSRGVARRPRVRSCTDPRTKESTNTFTYQNARQASTGRNTFLFSQAKENCPHRIYPDETKYWTEHLCFFIFYFLLFLFRRKRRNKEIRRKEQVWPRRDDQVWSCKSTERRIFMFYVLCFIVYCFFSGKNKKIKWRINMTAQGGTVLWRGVSAWRRIRGGES